MILIIYTKNASNRPRGTEIWFKRDKKMWTDAQTTPKLYPTADDNKCMKNYPACKELIVNAFQFYIFHELLNGAC